MNKKALYGLLLAILLPLIGYILIKNVSDRAVVMPRHYIYDDIVETNKKGKQYSDTIWHTIPGFSLTNQLGQNVTWKDIEGKIVVASFFFTRCPTICPSLTLAMKELQDGIMNNQRVGSRDPDFVHFLSFSIDPQRDSVPALKRWADRFQINPNNWWLLTGDKQQIYDLSLNEMRLGLIDGENVDTSFYHTDMFVLLDKKRQIRGYYHMLKNNEINKESLAQLSRDVIFLSMEKDPGRKFFLADKLELILIVFALLVIGLVLLFTFLKKTKKPE